MYASILCEALDRWETDLDDDALLAHVRACRAAMATPTPRVGGSWLNALSEEVEYDCALVHLAGRHGIDIGPIDYACPGLKRESLEIELHRRGIDVRTGPLRTT